MRRSIVLLATIVALSLLLPYFPGRVAQAQSQPAIPNNPESAEADRLSLEVVKLFQAAKYDEALPLAKRALKLRETALGQNHPLVAESLTNLAELYLAKGKFADAEPPLKRAMAIYEKNPNSNGLIVGKALDRMAALRLAGADVKKAEELFRRAIEVKKSAVGENHAEVVFSMDSLADLYRGQKDYAKAAALMREVVRIKEKAYGENHVEVGRSLERLACVLHKNNEQAESEKIEARANQILYGETARKFEPLTVSPASFECRIISNPRPEFPSAIRGRGAGSFNIMTVVDVDESGNVVAAHMVAGDPAFKRSAEQSAMKAKLRPLLVDGHPVKFKGILQHLFTVTTSIMLVPGVGRP